MKIEVSENSNESDLKQKDFPLDCEYYGENENVNENDLKIFIYSETLDKVDEYLSSDQNNELGGVLLGDICVNRDKKKFIYIDSLINAKHTNSSLSRLTFTHETWDYINEVREKEFPDKKILGWFHSHPGHTVFLSSFDIFIHENFFNMDYMVAYVFDPTIKERGFFIWRDGKIVRAEGYYVSGTSGKDEFNVRISLNQDEDLLKIIDSGNTDKKKNTGNFKNLTTISFLVLTLCILLLMIYNIYDINQKSILEEEYLKDLNEIKAENIKLTERLNNLMMEIELKRSDTTKNSEMTNDLSLTSNVNAGDNNKGNTEKISEDSRKNNSSNRKYVVKAGDTLEKIALKFYNTESATNLIMKQNNIKNQNDIRLGQELELPELNQ
ncbi:MAG: LysM peptidoglycan-binding domain-containing protein [Ignavibacteria bacterium]|nr:LysM peptidoglycan-binding domain-containing protein [Ignavibacteria bacterium]